MLDKHFLKTKSLFWDFICGEKLTEISGYSNESSKEAE
jgi:hypothetical protein